MDGTGMDYSEGYPHLFSARTNTSNVYFRVFHISTTQILVQLIPDGDSNKRVNFSCDFLQNQWNHLLVAFDKNDEIRCYVNGLKTVNGNAADGSPANIVLADSNLSYVSLYGDGSNSNVINAAGYGRGFRFYSGVAIDDVQASILYNSNTKEIQEIPEELKPFLTKELLMNQSEGSSAIDSSVNGFNQALFSGENPFGWDSLSLQLGGGAWVDVSLIGQ